MDDGKQETQILHNWLWAITPANNSNSGYMHPVFVAYCKQCNQYYTQVLEWPTEGLKPTHLPKWGCINPLEGRL